MIFCLQALFCYWLTSNLFTLVYGLSKSPEHCSYSLRREFCKSWRVFFICIFCLCIYAALRRPDVRKLLNLPDVVNSSTRQPSPSSPLPFSFAEPKDQSVVAQEKPPMSSESSSSVPDRRISRSSVLNQRIRTLERQLKDRKIKKWEILLCQCFFAKTSRYWKRTKYPREIKILS